MLQRAYENSIESWDYIFRKYYYQYLISKPIRTDRTLIVRAVRPVDK